MLKGQKQIAEDKQTKELVNKIPMTLKEHRELQKKLKEQSGTEQKDSR